MPRCSLVWKVPPDSAANASTHGVQCTEPGLARLDGIACSQMLATVPLRLLALSA